MSGWVETITKAVKEGDKKVAGKQGMTGQGNSGLGGLTGFRESGARPVKRHRGGSGKGSQGDAYGAGLKRGREEGGGSRDDEYGAGLRRGHEDENADQYGAGLRRSGGEGSDRDNQYGAVL